MPPVVDTLHRPLFRTPSVSLACIAEQTTLGLRFPQTARGQSTARVHADRGHTRLKCQVAITSCHIAEESSSADEEGPSCMFVGPVEKAEKHILEAFYEQARDTYYSGHPLVGDDIFDKVERRLRRLRSEVVRKYPRCSLRAHFTYSDAEFDSSQMAALTSIWSVLLATGALLTVSPVAAAFWFMSQTDDVDQAVNPILSSALWQANGVLASLMCFFLGLIVVNAAVNSLVNITQGKVAAMKGACPSCGEDVFVFVKLEGHTLPRLKSECHVCAQPLVFHLHIEKPVRGRKDDWAYGRIYTLHKSADS